MPMTEVPPAETALARLLFDEGSHSYVLNGCPVPGVTRVLESVGLIDYRFLGCKRDYYLDRGRAVHAACHYDDDGDLVEDSVDSIILGYVQAWRKFRDDYGFRPLLMEECVFNEQYQYAGRLDRTGTLRDGTEIILDIKSGQAPTAVRYQLAAYAACLDHPRRRDRRCVELHKDGTYRVMGFDSRDYTKDFEVFASALRVFRAIEESAG